jgi:hypothetical protein
VSSVESCSCSASANPFAPDQFAPSKIFIIKIQSGAIEPIIADPLSLKNAIRALPGSARTLEKWPS